MLTIVPSAAAAAACVRPTGMTGIAIEPIRTTGQQENKNAFDTHMHAYTH